MAGGWTNEFVLPEATIPTIEGGKRLDEPIISITHGGGGYVQIETLVENHTVLKHLINLFFIAPVPHAEVEPLSLSPGAVQKRFTWCRGRLVSGLTAAQAAVCGQLQSSLRAVPAVPCKLIFALLYASLSTCCHTAGVDQVCLQQQSGIYQTHKVMHTLPTSCNSPSVEIEHRA